MTEHDATAMRIANKYGVFYNRGAGVDVETQQMAIEVETELTISDAEGQLAGYQKSVYVAGSNHFATQKAKKHSIFSDIAVMDSNGAIVIKSTR